jgi:hypothetical protein
MYTRPPASVKVLGILSLVFAGFGVFGELFTWAMYFGHMQLGGKNPVIEVARANPTYMSYLEVMLWLGVIAALALGAAGIGLLKMRAWGRRLAIGYALYAIVAAIGGLVITYIMVLRPLADHPASGAGMAGGIWGGVLACVYPTVLLAFMLRGNVVDAFARANPPRGGLPEARVHH